MTTETAPMFVVDILYHYPHENDKDLGWCFSITPIEEFVQDQRGWPHSVGGPNTAEFEAWWRERFFYISNVHEMAQFQVSERIAIELKMRWV